MDRFSDGRFELEKRTILERWSELERTPFSASSNMFQDPVMRGKALDLLKQACLFEKVSSENHTSFKSLIANLKEDFEFIFSLSRETIDAQVAAILAEAEAARKSHRAAPPTSSLAMRTKLKALTEEEKQQLKHPEGSALRLLKRSKSHKLLNIS